MFGARPPREKAAPAPSKALRRNNTSFPAQATARLQALHAEYLTRRAEDTREGHWARALKYYQYLVRAVMTDPEYGIGADGNGRGLLIYHPMGLGKTRLAVAIAMSMWDTRAPVVLLPRNLQKNFLTTVAQVVALLNPAASPEELARLQGEAVRRFAFVSMDAYNSADQLARAGAPKPRKGPGGLVPAFAPGGLDGKLLLCDEAHNLFRAIINSSAEGANARRTYDAVMAARNLRVVFLTGTPVVKDPFELVPCFNMLAGHDLLPPQYETFGALYVDREGFAVKNRERLANRLVGLVSHATLSGQSGAGGPAPRPRDDGWFPEEHPTRIESVEMGAEQYRAYLFAREKEEAEGRGGEGSGGRGQALSAPPLALPGSAKKAMRSYFVKSRILSLFAGGRELVRPADLPASAFTRELGPKLARAVEIVEEAPGKVIVYSQFVGAGLEALGRYLELAGYARYAPPAPAPKKRGGAPAPELSLADTMVAVEDLPPAEEGAPGAELPPGAPPERLAAAKRYAIISGEVPGEVRDALAAAFNAADNTRGERIRALLISKTGAEGLDLKCVRVTVALEPYWDKAREDQVKARATRMGSHDALPRAERDVQPYLLQATANREIWDKMLKRSREAETIDETFHRKALARHRTNLAFRALLADVSLECGLNGGKNCRVCVPSDAPLFRADPAMDVRLPDPCETCREEDVEATPLDLDGTTFYYAPDPAQPSGFVFFAPQPDLGGFTPLDPEAPEVGPLLALLHAQQGKAEPSA